jgi:hypothetical protein
VGKVLFFWECLLCDGLCIQSSTLTVRIILCINYKNFNFSYFIGKELKLREVEQFAYVQPVGKQFNWNGNPELG